MKNVNESLEEMAKRQQEMEDHALALGGLRFKRKLQAALASGNEAQVGAAKKLLTEGLEKVEATLRSFLDAKKRGARHVSEKWLLRIGVDVASYIALKLVLDNIHGRITVRKMAFAICELLIDELRYRRFKEKAPRLFNYSMTNFTSSSYAYRARHLDARIAYNDIDISDLKMSQNEKFLVGSKLIDAVITSTGLVSIQQSTQNVNGKCKEVTELVATEDTLKWLEARNAVLENLWPVNLPMVMPPLPWAPRRRGGYRFGLRGKHRLVRSNAETQKAALETAAMPAVYSAINRIQETPWAINGKVLEVVQALMEKGGNVAGLPPMSDLPLPARPPDIDTNRLSLQRWKRAAGEVHDANRMWVVKRAELFRLMSIVDKVKEEAAIWFPHNLDFRGRVYPVVNYLHPQGDDLCKGLLKFAEGKPLGRDGACFLALHGASSLGKTRAGAKLSHMTLQERVDYMADLTPEIAAVAASPLENPWWMDADDRWQFLAFCFEWAAFAQMEAEGRGAEFVSSLACAMDGTCNGLQHYSALWLDPVGGAAVNVVPGEKPQDIYQVVADAVLKRLEVDAATNEHAALWLKSGLVDRRLTKRPTMTFGYGSQQFGFATQLREYVESHEEWLTKYRPMFSHEAKNKDGEVIYKSFTQVPCVYMAKLIWEALEGTVVSAFNGMTWFRDCAKVISKGEKKVVEWVVPGTGFPVAQGYYVQAQGRTKTILAGVAYRPAIYEDQPTPAWSKQVSALSPNVIHSLDAAALMMTVNAAADEGVTCFAMVHDSYGTLAADAGLLATATRQAFHGLYSHTDVVGSLYSQFQAQVSPGNPIPPPPEKGAGGQLMDLSKVCMSDYFFS